MKFKCIKTPLKQLDFFGADLKLNLNKKQKYQSVIGGLLSLIMYVIMIYLITNGVIVLITRSSYELVSQSIHLANPPPSILNKNNFMFALLLQEPISGNNRTLFQIQAHQIADTIGEDGNKIRSYLQNLTLESCTIEHFPLINFKPQEYVYIHLDDYQCLPLNYSIQLQGTFNSDIFEFFKFQITLCDGLDNCYTDQEIKSLNLNHNFQLSTLLMTSLLDANKDQTMVQNYIFTDQYLQTNVFEEQYSDIFLQMNTIDKDLGYLSLIPDKQQIKFWSFQLTDARNSKILHESPSKFFTINLRVSQKFGKNSLKYYQIDDFVSYVGGIIKFLTSCLGFFVIRYNQLAFRLQLANQLYNFNMPEKIDGKSANSHDKLEQFIKSQLIKVKTVIDKFKHSSAKLINIRRFITLQPQKMVRQNFSLDTQNKDIEDNKQTKPLIQKTIQTQNEVRNERTISLTEVHQQIESLQGTFLDDIFSQLIKSRRKISLGVYFLLQYVFCLFCIKKINGKIKLIQQCDDMIQNDLDIVIILDKIQQITKLKSIIFDKEQRRIFNYCPKPLVTIDHHYKLTKSVLKDEQRILEYRKINNNLIGKKHRFENKKKLLKLYQSYTQIQKNSSSLNERLISLLGNNMKDVFQYSCEIQAIYGQMKEHHEVQHHSIVDIQKDGKKHILDDGDEIKFE